jgi:predicted helicase
LDEDGSYWAIQAKCYSKPKLAEHDVSTFYMNALADPQYQHYMLADTVDAYTSNLEDFMTSHPDLDQVRLDLDTIRSANLDWQSFQEGSPSPKRATYDPRPHQRDAIDAVKRELGAADRCSLVMACGTGKTLTALRLSEELIGNGGTVLFLAPSISLVSQSMRDWVNQVRDRINLYVVCSDGKASKLAKDESYGQLSDIPFPATTNPLTVSQRFRKRDDALNVIFSTYQSIQVIHDAQEQGLFDFDLTICDEAHRTTGVMDGEATFQKIHDPGFIRSAKRLYMTATPRIYDEGAKSKAHGGAVEVASMDDETVYGKVAYRLSFGMAVEKRLLTDYKIVVMQVSEEMMGRPMQARYGIEGSEVPLDDAAKFVGCWKALFDRQHAQGVDQLVHSGKHTAHVGNDDSKRVLHHAIAFAPSIRASKALSNKFRTVIEDYTRSLEPTSENKAMVAEGHDVQVEIDHVDGGMDAQTRRTKLDWLAAGTEGNECHILSNARCLAEGIDVPDLDAVMYLSARRSRVDIIQSVGRVMRKAEGKEYGYIIIPVVVPIGADPDTILSSGVYDVVWDVVRALRSHDERLDAVINAAALGDTESLKRIVEVEVLDKSKLRLHAKHTDTANKGHIGDRDQSETGGRDETDSSDAVQPELDLALGELARGINAEIVRRCGSKIYWGEWTDDIASITQHRAEQIAALADTTEAKPAFEEFVQGLRDSLNPGYLETEAIAILAQHEITKPIFQTLFTSKKVLEGNPIVQGLDRALDNLYQVGLSETIDNPTLRELYASVRLSVAQVQSDAAKQNLIKEIYNEFFTKAFKDTADSLGIVYTPVEVADAQLHMVQRALQHDFHQSLGTRGVHVLDGFAGTGTYISRLIEDATLISDQDLPYKYEHDLHSNEIVPLAATIMSVNIEQSYHKRMGGDYQPFPGALLTDTFQMDEDADTLDDTVFTENTERVRQQKALPIKVIIGNPPYRAGDSGNTGNQNTKYATLDKRVETTYVAQSEATNNNSLYDHYIRAFRWASDRIGESGIVCFVSNGGWLTGNAAAGVRRCFTEEFSSIRVYNLRGNQRTSGEESRKEGGKIFASGSRATIAITLLVKNPESGEHGAIYYHDIGDYLTREQKLDILTQANQNDPEWMQLTQDKHGDWLDKRDDAYDDFIPVGVQEGVKKLPTGLFTIWSRGLESDRDSYVYNYSSKNVETSAKETIQEYNLQMSLPLEDRCMSGGIWSRTLKGKLLRSTAIQYAPDAIRTTYYRPFCKQYAYFSSSLIDYPGMHLSAFPLENSENMEIAISGINAPYDFSALIYNKAPSLTPYAGNGQCFPLYWYETASVPRDRSDLHVQDTLFGGQPGALELEYEAQSDESETKMVRHSAITDAGLGVFRSAYPGLRISKSDIFYYVYGVLHSPEYRGRFASNLSKELPRIPLAKDFKAFMQAGRKLAHLHVDYEELEPWNVMEVGDKTNPGRTVKMRYPNKIVDQETGKKTSDMTVLQVAQKLRIEGIPLRAYEYVVNGKSAVGWLIDRYQVTTDKKSGIVNDPNDYSEDPRYIVDLVEKVIRVSMETLDIMDSLPALDELPQPADWPAAWRNA